MKTFIAIAFLVVAPIAATTVAVATPAPSHDSCRSLSLHGIWDCR